MTKNIKILQVVDSYYPIIEGVVNVVDNYATILNSIEGVQCDVLVPKCRSIVVRPYATYRSKALFFGKFGRELPVPTLDSRLGKIFKNNHYDIIHVHSPVTLGRYAIKQGAKHNIPTVLTSHTRYHEEINAHVKAKGLRDIGINYCIKTMNMADYLWAPSQANADEMHQLYNISNDIRVVRNGTDMADDCPQEVVDSVRQQLYTEHGIDSNDKIILFVGRMVAVKNLDMLIDAMATVSKTHPQYKLVLVGDGEYMPQLRKHCQDMALHDTVKFVGAVRDRVQLTAFYKVAHLFAFPSTFDTGSLTIREAVALSLPVLVADNCSSAEEIVDGVNSYIADNDSNAWAAKIIEIFGDMPRYSKVCSNCHAQLYRTWQSATEVVLSHYRDIVTAHASDAGL